MMDWKAEMDPHRLRKERAERANRSFLFNSASPTGRRANLSLTRALLCCRTLSSSSVVRRLEKPCILIAVTTLLIAVSDRARWADFEIPIILHRPPKNFLLRRSCYNRSRVSRIVLCPTPISSLVLSVQLLALYTWSLEYRWNQWWPLPGCLREMG